MFCKNNFKKIAFCLVFAQFSVFIRPYIQQYIGYFVLKQREKFALVKINM